MSRDLNKDIVMFRDATISEDGIYRYDLTRIWDNSKPTCVFVMENPSTADGLIDDRTIKICIKIAMRENCGSLIVVNVSAYRCKGSKCRKIIHANVGKDNEKYVCLALSKSGALIIAAWGDNGHHGAQKMKALMEKKKLTVKCLGTTDAGQPKHPLARNPDTTLKPFSLE